MDAIDKHLSNPTDSPTGSPVFFVEANPQGQFIYGAGELAHALAYAPEALPEAIFALVSESSQNLLKGFWESVLNGHAVHRNEFAFATATGDACSFGLSLFPVFDNALKITSVRMVMSRLDVQKELSIALESAEERFSTVFQASSDPILILSQNHSLLSANPAFENAVGVTADAFFRGEHKLLDFFLEPGAQVFEELLETCSRTGEDQHGEFQLRVKDEEERHYDFRVHALKDSHAQLKGLLCTGRDIQGYKEIVRALQQEAEHSQARHQQAQALIGRLKEFLSNINRLPKDALPFVQGLGGIIAKLYPSSLFLLHVEDTVRETITGRHAQPPATEDTMHLLNSAMHRMVSESEAPLYCNSLDTTPPYNSDQLVQYLGLKSFVGAPMRDSDGSLLGTILLMDGAEARYDGEDVEVVTVAALMAAGRLRSDADAADKRELEAHLRQSQKMQAVGKLAGSIAHDFNNILSGILGFSSYLLRNAEPETDLHRDLTMIMKSAERASDLTRQLLSFSRKRHLEKKPVHINDVLQEVESIVRHSVAKKLKIKMDLADNLGLVLADDGQIHQVIMNLCINAADAMQRKKGQLHISSCQRTLSHKEQQVIEQPEEDVESYVVISVSDTGPGIPADIREHLFEPFFTTKSEDEGTGLGLSIVYGIVTNHGGGIKVDSEPGNGATFTIFLPVCNHPEVLLEAGHDPYEHLHGTERVLVVDDESIVRQMATQTLKSYGYLVTMAASGKEALALIKERPEPFDLVLMDLNMPDLDGGECMQAILNENPDITPVFMSAFPSEERCRQLVPNGTVEFIQKPFTVDTLGEVVRQMLDNK